MKSEAARSRANPLTGLGSPEIEFSAYEQPSAEVCGDYRNMLEDYGIDFDGVCEIASTYDILR